LVEILTEKGLEPTMAEWRSRRALLTQELRSAEQRLLALDEELDRALQETQQTGTRTDAGASSAEVHIPYEALNGPDLILAILRQNSGRMKSRLLYIEAEKHGKQRQTIYVTVSKLISAGVLKKNDLPGERGCILELPDDQ
jgi:hypothetical protein